MASVWGELKRRNVVKVAVAYAIVGWLLVEIASTVLPTFEAPQWVLQTITFVVFLGFPLALILSWAYEMTPEGIKAAADVPRDSITPATGQRLNYVILGLVVLAVGFLVVDQYVLEATPEDGTTADQLVLGTSPAGAQTDLGKPAHLAALLPPGTHLAVDTEYPALALSPNGSRLVFVADGKDARRLYIRDLADAEARPISGTEGAAGPFFSADGNWIGFFANGDFKKVPVDGGVPMFVGAANSTDVSRGATWTVNDTVISVSSANSGLSEFSIEDWTEPQILSMETAAWPDALPDGHGVLFTDFSAGRLDNASVAVLSLDTGEIKRLINGGTNPRYSSSGHILYARAGALFGVPFDALTTEVTGPEFKLLDGLITSDNGAAQFAVAADGTLAYVAGTSSSSEQELVWVDRNGVTETLLDNGRRFFYPRLSPDGTLLALSSPTGPNLDVWVLNLARGNLTRWTSHTGEDFGPVWGPDGTLAFASEIGEDFGEIGPGLAWMTGPGQPPEHLLRTPGRGNLDFPMTWSSNGLWLMFLASRSTGTRDIYLLQTETRVAEVFLETPFRELGARFSPDGQWVAYASDRSGRFEIYVQSFAGPGDPIQMSTNGGEEPVWARDGKELFYREGNKLMVVVLDATPTLDPSPPLMLFEGRFEKIVIGAGSANYDVSADGSRFVMVRRKNPLMPTVIDVVLNWPEALGVPAR